MLRRVLPWDAGNRAAAVQCGAAAFAPQCLPPEISGSRLGVRPQGPRIRFARKSFCSRGPRHLPGGPAGAEGPRNSASRPAPATDAARRPATRRPGWRGRGPRPLMFSAASLPGRELPPIASPAPSPAVSRIIPGIPAAAASRGANPQPANPVPNAAWGFAGRRNGSDQTAAPRNLPRRSLPPRASPPPAATAVRNTSPRLCKFPSQVFVRCAVGD